MSRTRSTGIVVLAAGSALGLAWLAGERIREVSALYFWWKRYVRRWGEIEAGCLEAAFQEELRLLVSECPPPKNAALRRHLVENILPGLAMYRILLREYKGDRQAALREVDVVLRSRTLASNRIKLAPLLLVPIPFWLFRLAFRVQMKAFPVEGWDFQYIEDSPNRVAFNATRCFYLNTLTALGAPELTASFCKTDDVMAELFPPSVRFIRPHTMGRGDPLCDFQYCRVGKFTTIC